MTTAHHSPVSAAVQNTALAMLNAIGENASREEVDRLAVEFGAAMRAQMIDGLAHYEAVLTMHATVHADDIIRGLHPELENLTVAEVKSALEFVVASMQFTLTNIPSDGDVLGACMVEFTTELLPRYEALLARFPN